MPSPKTKAKKKTTSPNEQTVKSFQINDKPVSKYVMPVLNRIDSLGMVVYETFWRNLYPEGTKGIYERWFFVLASSCNSIRQQSDLCRNFFKLNYTDISQAKFKEALAANQISPKLTGTLWSFTDDYWRKPDAYGRVFLNLHLTELKEPVHLFQKYVSDSSIAEHYSYKLFELFYPLSHNLISIDEDFLELIGIPVKALHMPEACDAIRKEWAHYAKMNRVFGPIAKHYLLDRHYWNLLQENNSQDPLHTYYQITDDKYWANCFTRR